MKTLINDEFHLECTIGAVWDPSKQILMFPPELVVQNHGQRGGEDSSSPKVFWAAPKKLDQHIKGGDSAPILFPCESPPEVLCANMGSSAQERLEFVRASPNEGHENGQRAETPIL